MLWIRFAQSMAIACKCSRPAPELQEFTDMSNIGLHRYPQAIPFGQ
jgi:hypothetical protein